MRPALEVSAQLLVAGLGGLVFDLLGLPAAWFSGAVVAVVIWVAFGQGRPLPGPLVDAAMLTSGVTMGTGVTPEALAAMERYPLSLAVLLLALVAITGGSALWLVRVSGWRRDDAILASAPGAMSAVLAVAVERGGAVVPITVVQSVRFLILVTLLPSAVASFGGLGGGLPLLDKTIASPGGLFAMLAGGWALGLVFARIGIAAPILFGGAAASALLHGTAAAPGVVPPVLAAGGFVLVGAFIADRMRGLSWAMLGHTLPAALGSFAVGMGAAAACAALAAVLARVPFADALVAFAPGGLEAMMVLALSLGLDPLYVGTHHLARFIAVGLGFPALVSWLPRSDPPPDERP
ncbi:MAG TPA: AbrB family transcriptional regulator [Microvirga sp.]|nr:AbrB family transcriptional regulator [Microvirga sp.]